MIMTDNCTSTKIKEVNEQSFNASKLTIETQLLENNTNIIDYLELNKFEAIRIHKNTMLDEANKKGTPDHALTENLATCDPTNQKESTNKNKTTTEENNQINTTVAVIDFLSLTQKNLLT